MSMLGALNKFLFNYHTLDVHLVPPTRSLVVTLKRPAQKNAINNEMIFELETLSTWLMEHSEVHSVLFKGRGGYFCSGFDIEEVKKTEIEALQKLVIRFQKLAHSMFDLPQTLIFDFGLGATGAGIELASAADIRLCSPEANFCFNQLENALPVNVGLLGAVMDRSLLRFASLSGVNISAREFISGGFIHDVSSTPEKYMKSISKQSPVARIQTKRAMQDMMKPDLERARVYDKIVGLGALETNDYQKTDYKQFIKARDFAKEFQDSGESEQRPATSEAPLQRSEA